MRICSSFATSGASRQFDRNRNGSLNFRSLVSTQPSFCFDFSTLKSQSRSPVFASRASNVPFSTPMKTTSPATAGEENMYAFPCWRTTGLPLFASTTGYKLESDVAKNTFPSTTAGDVFTQLRSLKNLHFSLPVSASNAYRFESRQPV